MKNFVQPGKVIPFTAGAAITSGDTVVVGDLVGVATGDVASGEEGLAELTGVYAMTKKDSQAWTNGAKVYWDATNSEWTTTAADGVFGGHAFGAAADTDATGKVRLATSTAGQGVAVADLDQTISGTYTQAEVQAISDKVDALLASLRAADIIAT